MYLTKLTLLNYKNIAGAELVFSPGINCFIGQNGEGKTNLMDAVYYLSFCKSASGVLDGQTIRHEEAMMVLQGHYEREDGEGEDIYCGVQRGQKKHFKRGKKEYKRLADHIGKIPLVLVSPEDTMLILGGSEERRKLMDVVISQQDATYLDALMRYNNALQQRNILLKREDDVDLNLMEVFEETMSYYGRQIYEKREAFIEKFTPIFQHYYGEISGLKEVVSLRYTSHGQRGDLGAIIRESRAKDMIVGHSLHGIHKDDLEMMLDGYPIKREGSQGQNKTYVISLKLAQFAFLKEMSGTTPLLLLDDVFDKLDSDRVANIVRLVGGSDFGQIFITDTNRDHLDSILRDSAFGYQLFEVSQGQVTVKV